MANTIPNALGIMKRLAPHQESMLELLHFFDVVGIGAGHYCANTSQDHFIWRLPAGNGHPPIELYSTYGPYETTRMLLRVHKAGWYAPIAQLHEEITKRFPGLYAEALRGAQP